MNTGDVSTHLAPLRTTFTVLGVAWAALLTVSLLQSCLSVPWWSQARLDLRAGSCLVLAIAAWCNAWTQRREATAHAALCVALGMSLGFYGDSHVGRRLGWTPFTDPLLGGIVLYGLGHLSYVAACWLLAQLRSPVRSVAWLRWLGAWQIMALGAWAAVALSTDRQTQLRIPTLAYTVLVAATPGAATALGRKDRAYNLLAAGAALFLVSDVLLAYQVFHDSFPGLDELTWLSYGPGEMLIVFGSRRGMLQSSTFRRPATAEASGG
ncbi:MAG: lysoplasmalogenase [Pirellulales bacterium]|nr:lysoplasmalogenase [Pirellulales bacterium]